MAEKSFSGRIGFQIVDLVAVAQNATVTVTLPPYVNRQFVAQVQNAAGKIIPFDDAVFTLEYDHTTSVLTYTNIAAGAFTGVIAISMFAG
mgnify:CR=1 FL=1